MNANQTIEISIADFARINAALGRLSDGQLDLTVPDYDLAATIETLVEMAIATE